MDASVYLRPCDKTIQDCRDRFCNFARFGGFPKFKEIGMRIYVAAPFPDRDRAREVRDTLVEDGHSVTARWLDMEHTDYGTEARFATMDVADVEKADLLLVLGGPGSRGGKHTELGIALAHRKPVIVIGEAEQVFHHHPLVWCNGDWRTIINNFAWKVIVGAVDGKILWNEWGDDKTVNLSKSGSFKLHECPEGRRYPEYAIPEPRPGESWIWESALA